MGAQQVGAQQVGGRQVAGEAMAGLVKHVLSHFPEGTGQRGAPPFRTGQRKVIFTEHFVGETAP